MPSFFEVIEGGKRTRIDVPHGRQRGEHADPLISAHLRGEEDLDPWKVAKRALELLEESRQKLRRGESRIAQLEDLLETDELTDLLNRRGLLRHLEHTLRCARRYGEVGALCYIDLDDFKNINDAYGHDAGDHALKTVASTLNQFVRGTDFVGRLSGDEFLALLVRTDHSGAWQRSRQLEQVLKNVTCIYHGHTIPIRASVGVAEYGATSDVENLLRRADQEMYEKKQLRQRTGRR